MSPHPSALTLHLLRLIALQQTSLHGFSASHAQASLALTDVLARFLVLLSSTAGGFAELSGRTQITLQDGVACLEQLGITLNDLEDVVRDDGRKRIKRVAKLKDYLDEGLDLDPSDHQLYTYADVPAHLLSPPGRKRSSSDASLSSTSSSLSGIMEVDLTTGSDVKMDEEGSSSSSSEESVSTPLRVPSSEDKKVEVDFGETLSEMELEWVAGWKEEDGPYGRLGTFLPPLPSKEAYDPLPTPPPTAIDNPFDDISSIPLPSASLPPEAFHLPSSSTPSFLHPSSASSNPLPNTFPTPSADPPAPLTTSSAPTFKALKAAHASLPPPTAPSYLSRNPNKPRVRAAYLLSLVSNPPENYSPTSSLFGSVPVAAPRSTGIVPTHPTDLTISLPPGAAKTKPIATHLPTAAVYPATPHRYPMLLSTLAKHMGNAGLVHKTTSMPYPPPLMDRGQPRFYGPPRMAKATLLQPVQAEEGEVLEEGEEVRMGTKSVDVELKATWDAPIRDWTNPELPLQRKRPPTAPSKKERSGPKEEDREGKIETK